LALRRDLKDGGGFCFSGFANLPKAKTANRGLKENSVRNFTGSKSRRQRQIKKKKPQARV
jgi:hypothetical protein